MKPGRPVPLVPLVPLVLILLASPSHTNASQDGAPARPNIVFLTSEDLGYGDAKTFGGWIPTPRLDGLAQQGARFTQAYSASPLNTPSRAGLLTGQHPARHGLQGELGANVVARKHERGLPTEVVTLPERLRALGYHTGMVGKWDLGLNKGMRPVEQGLDEFFGFLGEARPYLPASDKTRLLRGDELEKETESEYLTDAWAREAVAFLARNKASPFFLCVSFNAPHMPYEAPPQYLQRFRKLEGDQLTYAAMVSALDDAVGKILASLDQQGLAANTLVFFLSGNGALIDSAPGRNAPYSLGKGYLFEGGIRVPLLLRWPGRVAAGTSVPATVSLLDLAATALRAAGADDATLAELDGQDLLPALAGGTTERTLLWKVGGSAAIRRGDWKLITSKESRWLFKIGEDPGERTDLVEQEAERAAALASELEAWSAAQPKWLWPYKEPPSPARVFQKPYWVIY